MGRAIRSLRQQLCRKLHAGGYRYTDPAGGSRVVKLSSDRACLDPSGENANDGGDEHGGDNAY
jgi:hypothetical protein